MPGEATGIVNVWHYEPGDHPAEYTELASEFGDRLLVGIGIGHPEVTSDYKHPLAAMGSFLDGLEAAPSPLPADRRCLAALRPRMLELAAARARRAYPYFVSVEHTRLRGSGSGIALCSRPGSRASWPPTPSLRGRPRVATRS